MYHITDGKFLFNPNYYNDKGIWFYLLFYQSPRKLEDYSCNGYKYLHRLFRKNIIHHIYKQYFKMI